MRTQVRAEGRVDVCVIGLDHENDRTRSIGHQAKDSDCGYSRQHIRSPSKRKNVRLLATHSSPSHTLQRRSWVPARATPPDNREYGYNTEQEHSRSMTRLSRGLERGQRGSELTPPELWCPQGFVREEKRWDGAARTSFDYISCSHDPCSTPKLVKVRENGFTPHPQTPLPWPTPASPSLSIVSRI
jgi:hypothetical protein